MNWNRFDGMLPEILLSGTVLSWLATAFLFHSRRKVIASFEERERRRAAELRAAYRTIDNMAHEHWAYLAESSRALGASLDYPTTVAKAARMAIPSLADYSSVYVAESGESQESDPSYAALGRGLALECLEAGEVRCYEPGAGELPQFAEAFDALGIRSIIVAPLVSGDRRLGVMTFAVAGSGRHFGMQDLGLASQIASRAALALENATLYAKAQKLAKEREDIIAIVSHDLKNPLSAIELQARFLQRTFDAEARTKKYADMAISLITNTARKMTELLDDLLTSSRIESGFFRMVKARQGIQSLLQETASLMRPIAEEKAIRIEVDCPADYQIEMTRDRMFQVFSNLIGNAIKFSPQGKRVLVSVQPKDNCLELSVKDEGPGISVEDSRKVFDRYWQPPHTAHQGSGLGLSIARGIVEGHGGRIWVESTPGQGSTFRFTLPLVS